VKSLKMFWVGFFALMIVGAYAGCEQKAAQSPDVSDSVRKSLDQAGLKDVSVSQDRDKGVVTLGGHVAADADKSQAESIAKAIAAGEVVADQIAVMPPGGESAARAMNSDLDTGIEKNLDAALIQNELHKDVKYDVKNGGHAHRRGQLPFRARSGRTARFFSSQRKTGSERIADQERKGNLVELRGCRRRRVLKPGTGRPSRLDAARREKGTRTLSVSASLTRAAPAAMAESQRHPRHPWASLSSPLAAVQSEQTTAQATLRIICRVEVDSRYKGGLASSRA
jgi:hypothetical protein